MRRLASAMACVALVSSAAVGLRAQARAGGSGSVPPVTPSEAQRLFDSYALLQAQEQLKIGDEQYVRFLPRFKALQDVRRQTLQQRTRVLNEVRRLLSVSPLDEGQVKDRLRQLEDIDARGEMDAHKAYDAIDQVLDVRQQAQFRVFEEQMERRKLELVTLARQATKENNRNQRQADRP